jgi:hypothetical protein
MKSGERKKMIAAGVLLSVALVWMYFSLNPSTSSASSPDAASSHSSAISSLTKGDPANAAAAPTEKSRLLARLQSADPVLRLDLLARLDAVKYEGSDRNIFQFNTAPLVAAAPMPKPLASPFVGPVAPRPPEPPAPPPPVVLPPVPLKYYGVVTTVGASSKKVCLQDGEDIFVASEGELVKKRYRVIRVEEHSVEMEDTQSKVRTKIPLQEGT